MSESDSIIVDTTNRIFQDLGDPQTVNNAKDDGWKKPLWAALEESGLTLTWVPDTLGGAGAEISDGFDVLRAAGNHAVAMPLAETMLAGWLLAQAGIASPSGPMTVAPVRGISGIALGKNGKLSGTAAQVPFGLARWRVTVRRQAKDKAAPRSQFIDASTFDEEMRAESTGSDAQSELAVP